MADVFLTYAPVDAELALRIAKGLERAGLSVTRGPTQFTNDWAVRVFDSLDASSAVVALWSRDAMTRDWIASEAAIAAHFGQLVSIRVDPSLARDQIPAGYLEADGSVIVFESDIAPSGWSQASAEVLDRSLAPVSGKVRALKARGPVAAPIVEAGAIAPAEQIVAALNPHFSYARRDGLDKAAKTSPAMAATKRASAFRGAYGALEGIDFPADVRVGLVDLAEPTTADRGLARLYAEALSRNDKEFWGHVGRLALPLSGALALACLQRAGEGPSVVAELVDPRDPREMYAERFGRGRGRGGGRGNVVMWPVAVVALGVAALVAMPQLSKLVTSQPGSPSTTTADSGDAPESFETAQAPQPVVVPIQRAEPLRDVADTPLGSTTTPTTVKAIDTPPPAPVQVAKAESAPAPVQTAMAPPTPAPVPTRGPVAQPFQTVSAPVEQPQERLRYCRLDPGPSEFTVEVMPSEDLFEVAERVALGSKEGMRKIAQRNSACLGSRTLTLADGRLLSGRNLIFPGDRLVIPMYGDTQAAAATVTPAVAPPL